MKEEVCGVLEKLEAIENHYEELTLKLGDPTILSDQTQYLSLMKEHAELSGIVEKTENTADFSTRGKTRLPCLRRSRMTNCAR